MPVAKTLTNPRSLTGHLVSIRRDGKSHAFESSLERDLLLRLDFDPGVQSFEAQPFRIKYKGQNGEMCHYTPDALAHFWSGKKFQARPHFRGESPKKPEENPKPRLYEVRHSDELERGSEEMKPKVEAARTFAQERGWEFVIASEEDIRTPYLENVRLLRRLKDTPINDPRMGQAMDLMRERGRSTPEELSRMMCRDRWNRAMAIRLIWHLISRDWLEADLNQTLTTSSLIWTEEYGRKQQGK